MAQRDVASATEALSAPTPDNAPAPSKAVVPISSSIRLTRPADGEYGPRRHARTTTARHDPRSIVANPSPSSSGANDAHNLFVLFLPDEVEREELRQLFQQHGEVADVFIPNQRKGFGFVKMKNTSSADNAIRCLNGYYLKGKSLQVSRKTVKVNTSAPLLPMPFALQGTLPLPPPPPFAFPHAPTYLPYPQQGGYYTAAPSSHYHQSLPPPPPYYHQQPQVQTTRTIPLAQPPPPGLY
jgi:RNA recognition motif-containing protein